MCKQNVSRRPIRLELQQQQQFRFGERVVFFLLLLGWRPVPPSIHMFSLVQYEFDHLAEVEQWNR